MERLTKRIGNFIAYSDFNDNNSNGCYEMMDNCLHKLAEYEDLEEQGLLLRLPCKVGDTIYYFMNVDDVIVVEERKMVTLTNIVAILEDEEFGKTVFLTKEEAEQALKQMGE